MALHDGAFDADQLGLDCLLTFRVIGEAEGYLLHARDVRIVEPGLHILCRKDLWATARIGGTGAHPCPWCSRP
jgi:hypothetical protein